MLSYRIVYRLPALCGRPQAEAASGAHRRAQGYVPVRDPEAVQAGQGPRRSKEKEGGGGEVRIQTLTSSYRGRPERRELTIALRPTSPACLPRDAAKVFAEFSAEFEAEHGEGSARKGGFVLASGECTCLHVEPRARRESRAHPVRPTAALCSGSGSGSGVPKAYEPSRAASAFNRNPKVSPGRFGCYTFHELRVAPPRPDSLGRPPRRRSRQLQRPKGNGRWTHSSRK